MEKISSNNYREYLELYAEPLTAEEESAMDAEIFAATLEALPAEAGFTYEELEEQVAKIRDEDEWQMPKWIWASTFVGTKASEAVEKDKILDQRVTTLNRIFGTKLAKACREQNIVYGTFLIAPYFVVARNGPRLYRLTNLENTPNDVIEFFGLSTQKNSQDDVLEPTSVIAHPNEHIRLAADHTVHALTQYLGGKLSPLGIVGDFALIPTKATRGQKRELAVAEVIHPEILNVIDPETGNPMLERIRNERNEVKAKAFVGILALASQQDVDPEHFYVSIEDLMLLTTGYTRKGKNKTNSSYYWARAAEVVKYLLLDLACVNVRILVKLPHDKEPLMVEGWLMHRPEAAARQLPLYEGFMNRIVSLSNTNETEKLINYIKDADLNGFFLGFRRGILDALGARVGIGNSGALEKVSREVLKLKGPAFWLAYEIAFLRRWAKPKDAKPENGRSLLETLEKHGYCEEATNTTNGRIGYKKALDSWFVDLNDLIDINMLQDPGATIHECKRGRWYNVTKKVRGWREDRGMRVTKSDLERFTVLYHIPQERIEELAKPRAEKESRRKAYLRAQDANKGRSQTK